VRRHFETRASDDEEIAPSATDRRLPLAILEHRVWRGRRYAHAAAALRPALLLGAVRPCACAGVSGAKERTAATDRWIKDVTTHGHPILRQMHARGSRSGTTMLRFISCSAQVGEAETMLPCCLFSSTGGYCTICCRRPFALLIIIFSSSSLRRVDTLRIAFIVTMTGLTNFTQRNGDEDDVTKQKTTERPDKLNPRAIVGIARKTLFSKRL
jgi:hypothetical protein